MSASTAAAGALQISGGLACLLVSGFIQQLKGRLQGRGGPSLLQPFRELHVVIFREHLSFELRQLKLTNAMELQACEITGPGIWPLATAEAYRTATNKDQLAAFLISAGLPTPFTVAIGPLVHVVLPRLSLPPRDRTGPRSGRRQSALSTGSGRS